MYSPYFFPTVTTCGMSFWYHMYGATTSSLVVYELDVTNKILATVFSQSGNKGNSWKQATFTLKTTIGNAFRVSLKAMECSVKIALKVSPHLN